MLDKDTVRWFKRFRAHGVGGIVGAEARTCLTYARALAWLDAHDDSDISNADYTWIREHALTGVRWEPELESYESVFGATPENAYERAKLASGEWVNLCAVLYVDGEVEGSLGMVVVESTRDFYCRIVEASLVCEYLHRVGWQLELPLEAA